MTVRKRTDDRDLRKTDASTVPGSEKIEGGERVDQIREILFGAQRQEYERRLTQLEELLVKNIAELNKEMASKFTNHQQDSDKKFARLEELLVKNIADIGREFDRKIDVHKDENNKKFQQLEEHFSSAVSELKKETLHQFDVQKNEYIQKLSVLEDKLAKAISDINKKMDADAVSLTKSIESTRSEFTRNLEQLDSHKTDRSSLAKLLHNAAVGIEGKEHKTDTGGK